MRPQFERLEGRDCPSAITGTVFTDAGTTPDLSGVAIDVSVNGAPASGTTNSSAADGTYAISGLSLPSGAVISVYLQGNSVYGATFTTGTGGDLAIDIYESYACVRNGNGALSVASFATAVANGDSGLTAVVSSASTRQVTFAAGINFLVMSGQTFGPGSQSSMTVQGNFINDGRYGSSGAYFLTVSGNVDNAGTMDPGRTLLTLNGTGQEISGNVSVRTLTKKVATADTLTFADGSVTTVSYKVDLEGQAGAVLSLTGTGTAGWTIAMPATQVLAYLDVSYSTASVNTAVAGSTSIDGGNNIGWTF